MSHTFTQLYYHLVFSTKNRELLIDPLWRPELHAYIGGIVRNRKGELVAAGGIPDHIHLLVRLPATLALADVVRDVKCVSSGWRHDLGDHGFAWQGGYGAFTVSKSKVPTVSNYIEHQEQHHRGQSFQHEFVELLHRHEVEYDDRYLWD